METKRLYRSCRDKVLGGVAGGLGEYVDVDPLLFRIIFLLMLFSGVGFAAYIIAWILIPENPECKEKKTGAQEIKEKTLNMSTDLKNGKFLIGFVLLAFGALILSENLFGVQIWKIFWPSILILIGVYLISS
jgi:phage shock protein PspC (stress-responsive transcriptional regulator)